MRILEILNTETIVPKLMAQNKKDVLEELAEVLTHRHPEIDRNNVVNVLLERERLGTTGIGEGIAIPHGKMRDLKELVASFGKSDEGIDFQAMDDRPAHLFFLLLAPDNSAGAHLKALAKISRMLKDKTFCQELMSTETAEEIYQLIAKEDEKLGT